MWKFHYVSTGIYFSQVRTPGCGLDCMNRDRKWFNVEPQEHLSVPTDFLRLCVLNQGVFTQSKRPKFNRSCLSCSPNLSTHHMKSKPQKLMADAFTTLPPFREHTRLLLSYYYYCLTLQRVKKAEYMMYTPWVSQNGFAHNDFWIYCKTKRSNEFKKLVHIVFISRKLSEIPSTLQEPH